MEQNVMYIAWLMLPVSVGMAFKSFFTGGEGKGVLWLILTTLIGMFMKM